MIRTSGNIMRIGGNYLNITQDKEIILTINVIGTCFPSRDNIVLPAYLRVVSTNSVNNKIFIDYADGTGEHEYAFKASGVNRAIYFTNRANETNPLTVAGTTVYDVKPATEQPYGIHFYQDLPAGVINTVNDNYAQERQLKIRFEKPQNIISIEFSRVLIYGAFPSAIAKFRNLDTLRVSYSRNISVFNADFYNTQIRNLSFEYFGVSLSNGFPNWMLNSPLITLNLSDSIVLSGDSVSKKFNQINRLKNTLKSLTLRNVLINYRLPEEINELTALTDLNLQDSSSPALRFPENISGLTALSNVTLRSTRMPFSEIERLIVGLPGSNITLSIVDCNYFADYNLANDNQSIKSINIGFQRWNNGAPPSFLNKLKRLTDLSMQGARDATATTLFTNYGNFSACVNLVTLVISRQGLFTTDLPAWFNQLTKLKTIDASASFSTVDRINAYVNSMYNFVVANAPKVGTATTPFRTMTIDIYGSDSVYSARPSGTYQMPAGYVQGSNNGAPASAMEKIWTLANQYGHTWLVKPL